MPANDAGSEFAREADRLAEVLREAGEIALKTFRGEIRSWTKGHNSPVSDADIAIDSFLREKLARPGIGWLSEESIDDLKRLDSERIFIVDPIDGTRSYLAGREDWSICAALVERGRPVAAAIYAPALREMYVASAACGASLNGARIETSTGASLDGARVAGPQQCLDLVTKLAPAAVAMPRIHSLALRFACVASGQIDVAFASVNARDWDLAAADLLVHEAGGALTDIEGERLTYNCPQPVHGLLVAASRLRHGTALALIRERKAQFV